MPQPDPSEVLMAAAHRPGDDCAYLFGRECDCSEPRRLASALDGWAVVPSLTVADCLEVERDHEIERLRDELKRLRDGLATRGTIVEAILREALSGIVDSDHPGSESGAGGVRLLLRRAPEGSQCPGGRPCLTG
jgi:hypothetical protein